MAEVSPPGSSTSGLLNHEDAPLPPDIAQSTPQSPENLALLDVLREAVATGSKPTDAILAAIAETAGVLSGAHGIALALRQDGVILCRARSGDIAPGLGSPLNTDSGISGECLRTASILVCHDADTDTRVDAEVCRTLGIRSIAVVPLRGRIGMIGILEAFSARAGAFEKEQIDSLRALAEIAERAYERELRERTLALAGPAPPKVRSASRPSSVPTDAQIREEVGGLSLKRGYWIIGAVALAVLLITMVVRMSWRQTGAEIAASEPLAQSASPADSQAKTAPAGGTGLAPSQNSAQNPSQAHPQVLAVSSDPSPLRSTERVSTERGSTDQGSADQLTAGNLVRKAAEISPAASRPDSSIAGAGTPSRTSTSSAATDASSPGADAPPAVVFTPSSATGDLASMAAGSAQVPAFGGNISHGMTEASLIRKVDPIYPANAMQQKITGAVTLDATIAENGSVRAVTLLSGPPLLADAAATAVRQWRYHPASLNGKPVQVQKQITVVFKLP
jgi:TonB family protein